MRKRTKAILSFVVDYFDEHDCSPTLHEIVEGCHLTSVSVANYHLDILAQRGYITVEPKVARSIVIVGREVKAKSAPILFDGNEIRQSILNYLYQFIGSKGYAPTIRDIVAQCHLTSTSVAAHHLDQLQKMGYIRRGEGQARSIQLLA